MSWGYVDLTDWIPVDSDVSLAGYDSGYGTTLRMLKSTLVAYTVGGADQQNAELGIIDLVSKTKTVKYKFSTQLGTSFIRFYDKASGKYKTIGGWGMAGTGAPCGNNGSIYVIDDAGNIDVKCMPYSNTDGNVGICFYDTKTNYIYCGGDTCGKRIYRLKPDGSYDSDWSAKNMQSVCGTVILIPATETDLYLVESETFRPTNPPHSYHATVDVLDKWKSTDYIEDAFTELTITSSLPVYMVADWAVAVVDFDYHLIRDGEGWRTDDFETWYTVPLPSLTAVLQGVYLGRLVLLDWDANKIYICSPGTIYTQATISIPDSTLVPGRSFDPPFFISVDTTNRRFKIRALTYNNMVPMIQYDVNAGKVRVVDILTGNPVSGFKIKVYYSRFVYPPNIQPMRFPDFELTPSDYVTLPNPPTADRPVANMWLTL